MRRWQLELSRQEADAAHDARLDTVQRITAVAENGTLTEQLIASLILTLSTKVAALEKQVKELQLMQSA